MKVNKHYFLSIIFILVTLFTFSCSGRETLLILNWGEYINEDVVMAFEEKYNVTVSMSITDSNELFYSRIKSGTTAYDLVLPSDYMVEKMVQKKLLKKIDFSKLTNYHDEIFTEGAKTILDSLSPQTTSSGEVEDPKEYCVPYFYGTFGIMYDKTKPGLESIISDPSIAAQAFFTPSMLPSGTRVGIYDSPRFIYSAALQALGRPNINEVPDSTNDLINVSQNLLKSAKIYEWGFDTLKKNIIAHNLDLAYTWTGDMLDMLYMQLDDGKTLEEITFDLVIPDNTIAFMDCFVIPTKSRHEDLALKFIDFFIDPENAYANASTVGYCTPILQTYKWIVDPLLAEADGLCVYEEDKDWLDAWKYANEKYYPLNSVENPFKGVPLSNYEQSLLDIINQMVNKVKTGN